MLYFEILLTANKNTQYIIYFSYLGMIHHPQSQPGATGGGAFAWNSSTGDVGMVMKDGSHVPIEQSGAAKADEVEVMSTDSSSSSSTDSN